MFYESPKQELLKFNPKMSTSFVVNHIVNHIRHMGSFFKRIENMFFKKHIVPILL